MVAIESIYQGDIQQAEDITLEILRYFPRHADTLNLLSIIKHKKGYFLDAIRLVTTAIQINPVISEFHITLCDILLDQKNWPQATLSCYRALILKPEQHYIYEKLGDIFSNLWNIEKALTCYSQVLRLTPHNYKIVFSIGSLLFNNNLFNKSIPYLLASITNDPSRLNHYPLLAEALRHIKKTSYSIKFLKFALFINPEQFDIHNNFATAILSLNLYSDGCHALKKAIILAPNIAPPYSNLGLAFQNQNYYILAEEILWLLVCLIPNSPTAQFQIATILHLNHKIYAKIFFIRSLIIQPNYCESLSNFSIFEYENGHFVEALKNNRRSLTLDSMRGASFNTLGLILESEGRLIASISAFRKAIILQPESQDFRTNLAGAYLAHGDFNLGWPLFESRHHLPNHSLSNRYLNKPQWKGEKSQGGYLLIHAEDGLGDSIMFSRYIPLVAKKGWKIILEIPSSLINLMASFQDVDHFITPEDSLPAFDFHCPMVSLPLIFKTDLNSIPSSTPYIKVHSRYLKKWQERIWKGTDNQKKIGLVWASNSCNPISRKKSMHPQLLETLFFSDKFQFYSLQKNYPSYFHEKIINIIDDSDDFLDTAAIILSLDLIISVDTSVLHLSAALNKPTWLLDSFSPCWRWLRGRENSPWYPSLRIFRQTSPGDWLEVIERVKEALKTYQ
jgi:tetratricopeptide (TPR) repeat protein